MISFAYAFPHKPAPKARETVAPAAVDAAPMAAVAANDATGQSDFGTVSEFELAKVAALFRNDVEPDDNGGPKGGNVVVRPRRWQRDEVRSDLETVIQSGGSFPSQRAMAAKYGVPTTTLHDWFVAWEAEGQAIRRRQEGRRKVVG